MFPKPAETLHSLRDRIDKMLTGEGIGATVHSIQVLTATGEALSRPVSYLLSREPQKLVACIQEFTGFDEDTRIFTRSLAAFEIEEEPYLVDDLISATGEAADAVSSSHQLVTLEAWKYKGVTDDSDTHRAWLSCLGSWFPGLGSTLWVTQRCSTSEQAPKSSAFVLFSGTVSRVRSAGILYRISKLLRDALVTELVSAHQIIIKRQQRLQEALLKMVLSESSSGMPPAPGVVRQLQLYSPALGSNIPVLISGEAGTGKLAIAKDIHRRREAYLRARARASQVSHSESPINFVPAATLIGNARDIEEGLRKILDDDGVSSRSPVIVIDDVQVASPIAQDVLCRMLDEFIPGSAGVGPVISRGKFVFTSLPGLDALVACGNFSASLYAQISAFEVVCPPLRERLSDAEDCRRVLAYALEAIAGALEVTAPASLVEPEVEHIRRQQWPGNFRDLNNYLIRRLLESGRAAMA